MRKSCAAERAGWRRCGDGGGANRRGDATATAASEDRRGGDDDVTGLGVRAAGGDRLLGASCAFALAEACDRQGRAEAENWYREALRVREGILPAGHPQRASAMAGLGRWLVGHGRADEGERLLDEAFR